MTPSNKGSGQFTGTFHSKMKFEPDPPDILISSIIISVVSRGSKNIGLLKYFRTGSPDCHNTLL